MASGHDRGHRNFGDLIIDRNGNFSAEPDFHDDGSVSLVDPTDFKTAFLAYVRTHDAELRSEFEGIATNVCLFSRAEGQDRRGPENDHALGEVVRCRYVYVKYVIDDELMASAMAATGAATKREVVELGLKTLLRLQRQKEIKQLRGRISWQGDLETMRSDE